MTRRHLDNRRRRAFIPRIIFRARRAHDTPACGKSASGRDIFRSRGPTTGRPVERREAQRPFSGLRNPVGSDARLASGRSNPVRQARSWSLASSGKGSRKPLAPPGAPFAFWNGKREWAAPRPLNSRGGGALAELLYDFFFRMSSFRSATISLIAASSVSANRPSLASNSSNVSLRSIEPFRFFMFGFIAKRYLSQRLGGPPGWNFASRHVILTP